VHLIKHYYDVWIVVLSLVTVNVWVLALLIEACRHALLPEESKIEQLMKSHVVEGNVNN
jgi:hypothetical protein